MAVPQNTQRQPLGEPVGAAFASPTKAFFVRMLTRDITLEDAILDLLDNCVDGIIRSGVKTGGQPYHDYRATITLGPDHFSIEDNCGGIPIDVAKKYAFAMGRPKGADTVQTPATVGMYGIGMKRAIFKLGTDALVESRRDTGFIVAFTPKWMETDSWEELPMYDLPPKELKGKGTRILVAELHEEVRAAFADSQWVDGFRKFIARHYAIIISKGFSVTVGTYEEVTNGASRLLKFSPTDRLERI